MVERKTLNLVVVGSIPTGGALILVGVVGNISACHADARGSIPRRGAFWNSAAPNRGLSVVYLLTIRTKGVISLVVMIERCQRLGRGSIPR